jgi:hypothetical protein
LMFSVALNSTVCLTGGRPTMKNLVEQTEIDALCDELKAELIQINEYGPSITGDETVYATLDRLRELADRLTCPCRRKFHGAEN